MTLAKKTFSDKPLAYPKLDQTQVKFKIIVKMNSLNDQTNVTKDLADIRNLLKRNALWQQKCSSGKQLNEQLLKN